MRNVLMRMSARAGLVTLAGGLLGGVVTAVPAAAAGSCAMSGSMVTCTYSTAGTDTFTVPAGVSQVTVDALGAQGGAATDGTAGGYGGEATATIPVTGGQVLQVNVGGQPTSGNPAAGGFNGGGAGGSPPSGLGFAVSGGGGGGGASDVRQGGTGLASRVVIAGGGGGGGSTEGPENTACAGGTGGGTSGGDGVSVGDCSGGLAGLGGSQTMGGVGGTSGSGAGSPGTSGTRGEGGSLPEDASLSSGGGGGGGLFGGGGGSSGVSSGGGGGGSGLVPSGGTMANGVRAGSGQVTISYAYLPARITKAFGASSIPFGGSTSLTFTIANPNIDASLQLTGVGFTDTLPSGLVVATPENGLSGGCGGGTITAAPDSSSVTLSGAMLGAASSCTFSVNVTGTRPGAYTNTTGPVTWDNGGTGNTATASLTVDGCPAATPDARLLTATTNVGTILGGFCVNVLGTGTYQQGTASGTGVAEDILGITTVTANGSGLDLSGTGIGGLTTFHERAPVSATGTFTLSAPQ